MDELHDTAHLSEPAWDALAELYDDTQLLELLVLTGWYRTIAQLANALHLPSEPWATPCHAERTAARNALFGAQRFFADDN